MQRGYLQHRYCPALILLHRGKRKRPIHLYKVFILHPFLCNFSWNFFIMRKRFCILDYKDLLCPVFDEPCDYKALLRVLGYGNVEPLNPELHQVWMFLPRDAREARYSLLVLRFQCHNFWVLLNNRLHPDPHNLHHYSGLPEA